MGRDRGGLGTAMRERLQSLDLIRAWALFPSFVAAARRERDRPVASIASLGVPQWAQPPIFLLVNTGLGATVAGLAAGWTTVAVAGSLGVTVGGLAYAALTTRTLAYTVIDPPPSRNTLSIVP